MTCLLQQVEQDFTNWKSIPRPDLQLDIELVKSCWVEVDPGNGKAHVVIGYIYRHPSANIDDFTRKLDALIKNLNRKKLKVYISGDINIDFLKCNGHSPTKDHLEMLYSNNSLPIITKPTSLKIRQVQFGKLFQKNWSLLIVLLLKETVKPFYYKTNDNETAYNPLFFSFLSSLNNSGIVIYNLVILFSFFSFF